MRTICLTLAVLTLVAVPALGQDIQWTYETKGEPCSPTPYPDSVHPNGLIVCDGPTVARLDGQGKELWTHQPGSIVCSTPTVANLDHAGDPEVVFVRDTGLLECLDGQTGQKRWDFPLVPPVGTQKMVVAADLMENPGLEVLCGLDDGLLYCISADGKMLWRFHGDAFRVGGIAAGDVDGDGAIEVVYGTDNGHLYCLDGAGNVKWRYAERAPYGRSGPVLAQLDDDPQAEILITRSNVGNATCLIAVDGRDATCQWRTSDIMQGYHSNAVADLDGDGKMEILHGDKGNNLYCESADGQRKWLAQLNGRGIFWAPAVGDVDGDGEVEVVAGIRGADPEKGTSLYVVSSGGAIKSAIKIGSGANASPAIGDFNGDGEVEVIVAGAGPNRIVAYTWHGKAAPLWACGRGDSAMTGCAAGVMPGKPASFEALTDDGCAESNSFAWGENHWLAENAWPENDTYGFIRVRTTEGWCETRVFEAPDKSTAAFEIASGGGCRADLYTAKESGAPVLQTALCGDIRPPRAREVAEELKNAARDEPETALSWEGLHQEYLALEAQAASFADLDTSTHAGRMAASKAGTNFSRRFHYANKLAAMLQARLRAGTASPLCVWQDANPWDTFDPKDAESLASGSKSLEKIRISACVNEFEDVALTLLNTLPQALEIRASFFKTDAAATAPQVESDLAAHFQLRRLAEVPGALRDTIYDALPELGSARLMTLPPGEARQLWLVADTHGLAPGTHELTLYLSLNRKPFEIVEVPIALEIAPVVLDDTIYKQMNWCSMDPAQFSDQAVRDMTDHGISCVYPPNAPTIPVDAAGKLAGTPDWTAFDAVMRRIPKHFSFLWSAPPACQWPEGAAPAEDSPESLEATRTAIHVLEEHLETLGFSYDNWLSIP